MVFCLSVFKQGSPEVSQLWEQSTKGKLSNPEVQTINLHKSTAREAVVRGRREALCLRVEGYERSRQIAPVPELQSAREAEHVRVAPRRKETSQGFFL